jgi:tetratricopeptide (TPR) repeat protein
MRWLLLLGCLHAAWAQGALFRSYHDAAVEQYLAKNYDAADALFRTAVEEAATSKLADPLVALSYVVLGDLAQTRGQTTEAEDFYAKALDYCERNFGPDSFFSAQALVQLAGLKKARGETEQADVLYHRATAIWERLYDPETETGGDVFRYLGNLYILQGKWKEAEPLLRDAAALDKKRPGPDPEYAGTLRDLAFLMQIEGRLVEADSLRRQVVTMTEKYFPNERWRLFGEFQTIGDICKDRGRLIQAESFYKKGIELSRHLKRTDSLVYARCLAGLAEAYIESKKNLSEAERLLTEALAIFARQPAATHLTAGTAKREPLIPYYRALLTRILLKN